MKIIAIIVVVALVAVLAAVFFGGKRTSGEDARKLVADGAVLLDVRTPQEFASGHIEGATNIPVQELDKRMDEVGETSNAVVVYCRSGARSARAASMLRQKGFAEVHDIGGMSNW